MGHARVGKGQAIMACKWTTAFMALALRFGRQVTWCDGVMEVDRIESWEMMVDLTDFCVDLKTRYPKNIKLVMAPEVVTAMKAWHRRKASVVAGFDPASTKASVEK